GDGRMGVSPRAAARPEGRGRAGDRPVGARPKPGRRHRRSRVLEETARFRPAARSRATVLPVTAWLGVLVALALQAQSSRPIENEYVRVTRDAAPCAAAAPSTCGERVLVALGPIRFEQYGQPRQLERGEIAVFRWNESYTAPMTGSFVEVSIKQDRPRVQAPPVLIAPEKNQ